MSNRIDIDELFKSGLNSNLNHTPSASALESMGAMLDAHNKSAMRRKRRLVLWRSLATAAVFTGILFFIDNTWFTSETPQNIEANKESIGSKEEKTSTASNIQTGTEEIQGEAVKNTTTSTTASINTSNKAKTIKNRNENAYFNSDISSSKTPQINAQPKGMSETENQENQPQISASIGVSNQIQYATNQNNNEVLDAQLAYITPMESALTAEYEDPASPDIIVLPNENPRFNQRTFGIIVGGNISNDITPTDQQSNLSGNEFFGISYTQRLKGNWSIYSNLLYQYRPMDGLSKNFEDITYDFGYQKTTTEVTALNAHYLELPIAVHYQIGSRHTIYSGLSASYLIACKNQVETTTVSDFETTHSSEEEWGHKQGLNNVDIAALAGYNFNVLPKLSLGARVNYGLLDVAKNDYYQENAFNRNVQFRIYLNYSLFSF